jgi:hypothetical protein
MYGKHDADLYQLGSNFPISFNRPPVLVYSDRVISQEGTGERRFADQQIVWFRLQKRRPGFLFHFHAIS